MPDESLQGRFPSEDFAIDLTGTVPVKVIPTGPLKPAAKRDMAINQAKGEILAFIDDDAYPEKDWLKNAVKHFENRDVAAVCGPAITPADDTLRQKASGAVFSSFLVSGSYAYRYLAKDRREVDDYPSCNFLLRTSVMKELGGFSTDFWPGEDTKLCLDITKKLGKKIIYDPGVLAYHHRRTLFLPHLKQIASYALHRGYFVKKYPQTSMRIAYFLPSIFVAGLILGGIISLFSVLLRQIYFISLSFYVLIVFVFSILKGLRLFGHVFLGILLTHFTYGAYFLKGLFSRKLAEER